MTPSKVRLKWFLLCLRHFSSRPKVLQQITELPKVYSSSIESELLRKWDEQNRFIKGKADGKKCGTVFSMILPPPNVTGTLHLGHSLTVTIQDVIARRERLRGRDVLWIPGTDHAGIATQTVVERDLQHTQNIDRHALGRERFLQRVWEWKDAKSGRILNQLKGLGASLDWSHEYFTLDETRSRAVTEALIKLWNSGLIYRGETVVNWSCLLRSAVSDIEVDHINVTEPTKLTVPGSELPVVVGRLIYFAYKVANSDKEIVVATTRPETIMGDVAVAVYPQDKRFTQFHGCQLIHPFTGDLMPLIIDEDVKQDFGTGAVKLTPSHDPFDFELGKKYNLPCNTVIDEMGMMKDNCLDFSGRNRFEVREAIIKSLEEKQLLRDIVPHAMSVPICSRTGEIIEFLVRPQWFLNCKEMAKKAADAVRNQELIIEPSTLQPSWYTWLDNIRDWCISRQLWWGHQVPFYLCKSSNKEIWVAARSEQEAKDVAEKSLSGNISVQRDFDVLDTWLSSSLLPFSSLAWPDKDFSKGCYPLSLMVTGHDILFFWVARMTMLGLELTKELPFKRVLLHSIVCDHEGRKMSKSLGNVIDPFNVINGCSLKELNQQLENSCEKGVISKSELKRAKTGLEQLYPQGIPQCGIDALRFTLLTQNIKNHYINFNVAECHSNKLFCNKVWQAVRFACGWYIKIGALDFKDIDLDDLTLMDKWILSQLSSMVDIVNSSMDKFDFHLATSALRHFLYGELCDVYIEVVKPSLRSNDSQGRRSVSVLLYCLETAVQCLSPFMPFLSETVLSHLPHRTINSYPENLKVLKDVAVQNKVSNMLRIILEIRRLKSETQRMQKTTKVHLDSAEDLTDSLWVIESLSKTSCTLQSVHGDVRLSNDETYKKRTSHGTIIYLIYDKRSNEPPSIKKTDAVVKRIEKLKMKLEKMNMMMSSEGYRLKVNSKIKAHHVDQVDKLKEELQKLSLSQD